MLYSHSIEDEKFDLFKLFLKHILEGENDYKESVNYVIEQTHDLITGSKDYYSIDRDNYSIIVYLSKKAPEYFETIKSTDLTDEDYDKILRIIDQQRFISTY